MTQTWRAQTVRPSITCPNHDPVRPVHSQECFPRRPAMAPQRRSAPMTTQRLFATAALAMFLGIPASVKAQFDFHRIDVPGSTRTAVNANSAIAIAGEFDDADGNTHGFVLRKRIFTTIDV